MKQFLMITVSLALLAGGLWGQTAVVRDDILKDPEWKNVYDDHPLNMALIESLKHRVQGLQVDVYLAFWCPDSRNNVPVFLKIVDALNLPADAVHFYEVERKATPDRKFYVEDTMVERVPTFIFQVAGVEKGRIVENPQTSILEDMLAILL